MVNYKYTKHVWRQKYISNLFKTLQGAVFKQPQSVGKTEKRNEKKEIKGDYYE